MSDFASLLIDWQRQHGRQDLPWQGTRDPYRIWLSEVMLQQTQVAAVIPYYQRFLARFPTVQALAAASEDEVLQLWSGLGYYARGRNLHAAARHIAASGFPKNAKDIEALPGVGRSTAAAIAAFAFGERAAILDGNVKRVLARCFGLETEKALWDRAERLVPASDVETYTQALMDLGATVCGRINPRCDSCPLAARCVARRSGRTAELPVPRARKPLPQKAVNWLVLRQNGAILLEKRPPAGIWGGLWSFPETDAQAVTAHARRLGCEIQRTEPLAFLEHGFTHFRLQIRPLLCEVAGTAPAAHSPGRMWLSLAEAAGAAIPTPVRKLIEQLAP